MWILSVSKLERPAGDVTGDDRSSSHLLEFNSLQLSRLRIFVILLMRKAIIGWGPTPVSQSCAYSVPVFTPQSESVQVV